MRFRRYYFVLLLIVAIFSFVMLATCQSSSTKAIEPTPEDIEGRLRCATTKVLIKHFIPNIETLHSVGFPSENKETFRDKEGDLHQKALFQKATLESKGIYKNHVRGTVNLMKVDCYGDYGMSGSALVDGLGYVRGAIIMKERGGHAF